MKKLTLVVVIAMITSLTFAQKLQQKDVPVQVKIAFQKQFPNTKEAKWEKEGNNFEAEFELNKTEQSVVLDAKGNLIETEIEIAVNQLPNGVLDYITTNDKEQKVKEAAKITNAKGIITYEAEIKGMDLIFDSNGKFVKEIKY